MKIPLPQIKKGGKQKYLIFIFVILILIGVYFLINNFLIKKEGSVPEVINPIKSLKIDFGFLEREKEVLDEFIPFEEIKLPAELQAGRQNPFNPY